MSEIKRIKGFEEYSISSCGKVYCKDGSLKALQINKDGYYVTTLYQDGKYHMKRVGRLVALHFVENPDPEKFIVVDHIDGDKQNDHYTNLEWVTISENTQRSVEMNPMLHKGMASHTEDEIHEVCKLLSEDYRNKDISDRTGVSLDTVKKVRSGTIWKEISKHYTFSKKARRSVSESTVIWVCERILEGFQNREIVAMSHNKLLTKEIVKQIRAKRTHKTITEKYLT